MHEAAHAKKDEFYTQRTDIGNELHHYREHFKGKTVFCNCDDPYESNFFKYFAMSFNTLGLKKLISACYATSPLAQTELTLFPDLFDEPASNRKKPYKVEITEVSDYNNDGAVDLSDVEWLLQNKKNTCELLKGDGDFRSNECIELLKQADIVVTNPPFSLFREYVGQLVKYDKKFVIIGNKNAITYKEIFPLIAQNKLWTGYRGFSGGMWFKADYEGKTQKIVNGIKLINVPSIWFTNLDIAKRHENIPLFRTYNPQDYPKYDNYDAINVDKVSDIPCDYHEAIGVPITFFDKYNPKQFEIIGATESEGKGFSNGLWDSSSGIKQALVNGVRKYKRLFIRAKDGGGYELLSIYELAEIVKTLFGYSDDEISVCSGIMGVPITFLDKYNPEQFEIVAFRKGNDGKDLVYSQNRLVRPYFRILIKRKRTTM